MFPRRYFLAFTTLFLNAIAVSAHAATIEVAIENVAFAPTDITAKVGDTIVWNNKEIIVHTATAKNGDWDVNIPSKTSGSVVLKKAGEIDYYCRFHPNMKGHIGVAE